MAPKAQPWSTGLDGKKEFLVIMVGQEDLTLVEGKALEEDRKTVFC